MVIYTHPPAPSLEKEGVTLRVQVGVTVVEIVCMLV